MNELPQLNGNEKHDPLPGRRILLAGFLILWIGSIALALVLKTLLTPESFPVGSDPSFYITLAAFCFLLGVLGIILIVRGLLEEEGRLNGNRRLYVKNATIGAGVAMAIVFVIGALLLSANNAFAAQFKPRVIYEPRPDDSMPAFPTPALSQPIPAYGPEGKYLLGPVNSAMDGLRVGDIWISVSPTDGSIKSVEISLDPIVCRVQTGGTVMEYGVDKSKQLLMGPVQILPDGSFFAGEANISLHGVLVSADEMRGTLFMRYTNPTNQQVCDLGTFEWSAQSTNKIK